MAKVYRTLGVADWPGVLDCEGRRRRGGGMGWKFMGCSRGRTLSRIRMRMMPGIMMPAIVTAMMKKARLSPTKGLVGEMVTVGTLEPDMIRR